MSDRSNKPSFAVSRNLKHAKYHFIEAISDKLTESSNTTPNCFNINLAMCNIQHDKHFTHNVANVTFVFGTSPNTKPEEKKWGGIAYYVPLPDKVGGTRPPCPPPNCAHVSMAYFMCDDATMHVMYSRICLICHRLIRQFVTFASVPAQSLSFVYISVRLIRHLSLSLRSVLFS